MKNLLYIITAILFLTSCSDKKHNQSSNGSDDSETTSSQTTSTEQRIIAIATDTAISFLKNDLIYPESFKLEDISVESEPVPVYFNAKIQKQAKQTLDALEKFKYYNDLDRGSGLWHEELSSAVKKYKAEQEILQTMCNERILDSLDVRLVALVKYSGENSYGNRIDHQTILIIDPETGQKILGEFDVNKEFIQKYLIIMNVLGIEIPENEYGKTEVDSLPRIDRFIFSD